MVDEMQKALDMFVAQYGWKELLDLYWKLHWYLWIYPIIKMETKKPPEKYIYLKFGDTMTWRQDGKIYLRYRKAGEGYFYKLADYVDF